MMDTTALTTWFDSLTVDHAESIKLEFAVAMDRAIHEARLSRKDVAAAMKTSPAWVTKVLRGDVNLTIESMAKLCQAIGHDLEIKVAKRVPVQVYTTVTHVDFSANQYARRKFNGAFEIDLTSTRSETVFNDEEYANAA
jgi:transcriptional regulator with XRE-family HTH domain